MVMCRWVFLRPIGDQKCNGEYEGSTRDRSEHHRRCSMASFTSSVFLGADERRWLCTLQSHMHHADP